MASGGKRRRIGVAVIVSAVVIVVGGAIAAFSWSTRVPEVLVPRAGGDAIERPLTPAQQLVADAGDPLACAVSFIGDGAPQEPMLQRQDALYVALPIPAQDGRVFAGWYSTAADAAGGTVAARINGADPVVCVDQQIELFAAWTTPEANAAADVQVPILMYHQFTSNPEGETGWLRGNYAYIGDFEAQMSHIASSGFYMPTWDELSAFIDGRLFLPAHSVIISDDDADPTWIDLAAPVVARRGLLTTSFVITSARSAPSPNPFVLQRSHTHDMHRAGANGKGRMVNEPVDVVAADLERSAQILGAKEVVAYPYGHYNDTAKQAMRQAGFALGRTTEHGYVRIGTDKLALPVIRVDYGMSVTALARAIG